MRKVECSTSTSNRCITEENFEPHGKRELKTPADSKSYIAEIVGDESLIGQRMTAGKLFHMMDIAAADAAFRHAETHLVTLAFDRIELLDFIRHRDYVRFDTTVIQVGRSSIVVEVTGLVKSPTEIKTTPMRGGFITMVAIHENGKPNKTIPSLTYRTEADLEKKSVAEERSCMLAERKKSLDSIDRLERIPKDRLKDYSPRVSYLPPSGTVLDIRRRFLPRNANQLGIVFGGDTVVLMEELALATARQFTGNIRMVTIAMEDVLFLKPLHLTDLAEMTAKVVFVGSTTLVVEVTVKAIRRFGPAEGDITNKGTFTVLNYSPEGKKKPITRGLDLSRAVLPTRKSYLKEQIKYEDRTGREPTFTLACRL
jgi:acyl-CoA thioesterase YciA